jgi:enoyl-CoA hydratase/carnithine racemase
MILTFIANGVFKGTNPGGGGIELLARLAGRSRALEVVLGAERIDADTAALYGCM